MFEEGLSTPLKKRRKAEIARFKQFLLFLQSLYQSLVLRIVSMKTECPFCYELTRFCCTLNSSISCISLGECNTIPSADTLYRQLG